ncbi:hypothetical protein J6590_010180 [Homalodisca vitripennis]|nr:hypothetical protein J6590_010180 [Homalodisca vitripennis]
MNGPCPHNATFVSIPRGGEKPRKKRRSHGRRQRAESRGDLLNDNGDGSSGDRSLTPTGRRRWCRKSCGREMSDIEPKNRQSDNTLIKLNVVSRRSVGG